MLELKSVMVCDAASVREGLLHVLGAGLTMFTRDSYPAPFAADVALMFQASGDAPNTAFQISIVARQDADALLPVFEAELDLISQGDGALQSIPLALNLHNAGIPAPGLYTLEVLVNSERVGEIQFIAQISPAVGAPHQNPFA